MTFVIAEDWIKLRDSSAVSTIIKKVPVPGPKKPSYRPMVPITAMAPSHLAFVTVVARSISVPKPGRNVTYTPTHTSSTITTGRITSLLIRVASRAPPALHRHASGAAMVSSLRSTLTRRSMLMAAEVVPPIEVSLFVPSAVASCRPGAAMSSSGIMISPPPPTMASMNPAIALPLINNAMAWGASSTF